MRDQIPQLSIGILQCCLNSFHFLPYRRLIVLSKRVIQNPHLHFQSSQCLSKRVMQFIGEPSALFKSQYSTGFLFELTPLNEDLSLLVFG